MTKPFGTLFFLCPSACSLVAGTLAGRQRGTRVRDLHGESSVLVQEYLHTWRHPLAPTPQPGLDLDGCPAPPGYEEALRKTCRGGRLVRRAGCSIAEDRRVHAEPMKEVYFLRHATPMCCQDCGLTSEGVGQCESLKVNNTLLKTARSLEQRADVVYVSPTTRTMETAIRLFGDLNVPMIIDYDLVETCCYDQSSACRDCARKMLQKMGHHNLMTQYNYLQDHEGESYHLLSANGVTRTKRFTDKLLQRPEKRIVVVSHHMLLDSFTGLGMGCMTMGETVIKAGLTNESWTMMSDMSCQGRRRRWRYGNYRRKVLHDSEDGPAEVLHESEDGPAEVLTEGPRRGMGALRASKAR